MFGNAWIYRFLLPVITAFAVAGCSPPVGSIGEGNNASIKVPGGFLVYPQQRDFEKDAWFYPNEHLKAYITYRDGEPHSISPDEYEIWYIDNRNKPDEMSRIPTDGFKLTSAGEKDILVRYNTTNSNYSFNYGITVVEVDTNFQAGMPIGIKWKNPIK